MAVSRSKRKDASEADRYRGDIGAKRFRGIVFRARYINSPPGKGDWFLASPDTVRPTDPNDPGFFRSMQVRVPAGGFVNVDVA